MKHLIIIATILAGCGSTKDTTGAAEREALRSLQGRQLDGLTLAPPLTLQGETYYINDPVDQPAGFRIYGQPGGVESGVMKSKDGRLMVKCPDKILNLDSILRSNPAFLAMVTAWKLAEAIRDSTDRANVGLQTENYRLTKANRATNLRFYGLAAGVIAFAAGWLVWKVKTGGFGLLKRITK